LDFSKNKSKSTDITQSSSTLKREVTNVNIINNKQNTTYPFSKNIYIVYYQRVMSRKSGVWSSVGDDGESSQEREFLRWSEKRGLTPFCYIVLTNEIIVFAFLLCRVTGHGKGGG